MSHRIWVNPGTEQAWQITLRPGVNRVGRTDENDIAINHPSISTHHCELTVSSDGVLLKDLGSTNGTFINRSPVTEVWLQPGQHIQFGAIDTLFEAAPTAPAVVTPSQPAPGATVVVAAIGSPPGSPAPASPGGLRLNRAEPPEAETSSEEAAEPAAAPAARPKRFPVHVAAEREAANKKRFLLGAIGAAVGGLLGAVAWYFLIKATGYSFSLVAWGVGVVTGIGARLLAKEGNLALGVVSGVCALVAIVFGEYLAVKALVAKEAIKEANKVYLAQMIFAREAVKAETPEDFRKLLAELNEKSPEEITDADIKQFQEEEMPMLRDFARGKPTRAEFAAQFSAEVAAEFDYKNFFFKEDVKAGLFLLLFAALGVVTAYKIGSGEDDEE